MRQSTRKRLNRRGNAPSPENVKKDSAASKACPVAPPIPNPSPLLPPQPSLLLGTSARKRVNNTSTSSLAKRSSGVRTNENVSVCTPSWRTVPFLSEVLIDTRPSPLPRVLVRFQNRRTITKNGGRSGARRNANGSRIPCGKSPVPSLVACESMPIPERVVKIKRIAFSHCERNVSIGKRVSDAERTAFWLRGILPPVFDALMSVQ